MQTEDELKTLAVEALLSGKATPEEVIASKALSPEEVMEIVQGQELMAQSEQVVGSQGQGLGKGPQDGSGPGQARGVPYVEPKKLNSQGYPIDPTTGAY